MKKNLSGKILTIFIVFLFISSGFVSVSANIFKDYDNESIISNEQNYGLNDFFDMKISFLMKFARFPSVSACIINNDRVIWSKGYGYYDLRNQKESDPDTIYVIASVTKTIV